MKEIKTAKYKESDLKTFPSIEKKDPPFKSDNTDTKEDAKRNMLSLKKKKKKKLPQLGVVVDDIRVQDITD